MAGSSAALFLLWLLLSPLDDQVLAVELGYCATTALLAVALWLIEPAQLGLERPQRRARSPLRPDQRRVPARATLASARIQ